MWISVDSVDFCGFWWILVDFGDPQASFFPVFNIASLIDTHVDL
jgi:hypothetical protein